jgi:hypothetical protein
MKEQKIQTIKLFTPYEEQKKVISSLENEDIFYVTLAAGRQVGKTLLSLNIVIKWLLSKKNITIMYVSPVESQSRKVYTQLHNSIIKTGLVKKSTSSSGNIEIVMNNNSKVLFKAAAAEDSLRGETLDYLIIDEAVYIKEKVFLEILMPMLSVKGKKVFILSTTKGKNWFYNQYMYGLSDDPKYIRYASHKFTSYDSPYNDATIFDDLKSSMSEAQFNQEIMAEFIDSATIFDNLLEQCTLEEINFPLSEDKYFFGIDIGLKNDATVISIFNQEGHLIKYYRYIQKEAPFIQEQIITLNNIWKPIKILIEENNQGLVIYQNIKSILFNKIETFCTTNKSKNEIINKLIYAFQKKEIFLINDEPLKEEFSNFVLINSENSSVTKFSGRSGFHDDIVMATAIAYKCYEDNKNKINTTKSFFVVKHKQF